MHWINFWSQPDFKAHPLRAISRRIRWRLHWRFHPERPLVVLRWWRGMQICLPKSGSAAQILYRGLSSSPIVETMVELLRDGMVMIDIGAHIGEYTLIGAKLVGPTGQVHAFEPQPTLAEMIKQNAARNDLTNVTVYNCAVADFNGSVSFVADPRSMAGWIAANPGGATAVPCITLEQLVLQNNLARIDLVKIDAAGNELSVLRGGTTLLSEGRPAIICKLYHPAVIAERVGYDARMTIELLRSYKYELFLLDGTAESANHPVYSLDQIREHFDRGTYGLHLLALGNGRRLPTSPVSFTGKPRRDWRVRAGGVEC